MLTGNKVFIWKASTIDGAEKNGIVASGSKALALQDLKKQKFYQIHLSQVPRRIQNSQLPNNECVDFVSSIVLLLNAGISLVESLEWLQREHRPLAQQYILCQLSRSLDEGDSLLHSFKKLKKQFTPFFLTMIEIAEQSNQLQEGLQSLLNSLEQKENRRKELKKLLRYPKIVLITTMLLILGVIAWVIPMFKNIYLLFENDLPVFTRLFLFLSDTFHQYLIETAIIVGLMGLWSFVPILKDLNPVTSIKKRFVRWVQSSEDLFLYSLASYKLLDNGIPLKFAMEKSVLCLSAKNRLFGNEVLSKLDAGLSLSRAFRESKWFPDVFHRIIASSEKAGYLANGFHHICIYLEQKREESFHRWQRLIEPIMMFFLGGLVLVILLAVYLPIFDLGNRIG